MQSDKYAKQVSGNKKGEVFLFALSTCGWCKKTKDLLDELGVEYSYIDVDLLEVEERKEVLKEMSRWNERRSFPTLVINNTGVIGFQEDKVREVLGSG